ncbi:MAG: hypothetical protein EAZ24_05550 [Burkholderiales bacterium]|nr:MAG: hypothetical protein EAZ24_05550 [Burkholderiales bacterium]TAG81420.1 MAG: hypothetical protein EAZ21_06200 [Betaproteobacteria bacterium]
MQLAALHSAPQAHSRNVLEPKIQKMLPKRLWVGELSRVAAILARCVPKVRRWMREALRRMGWLPVQAM